METPEKNGFVYEFGKFVLDPYEKTLFSDGLPMRLPTKEFETLLLLVENNGRALTKDDMIAAVWQDAFVEESNLAKQISKLRKILNSNGNRFIETLPKHGYRFSAEMRRTYAEPSQPIILEKRTVKRLTFEVENEVEDHPIALRPQSERSTRLAIFAVFGLIVLLGGALWYSNRVAEQAKIKSIAVLPLKSLTSEENNRALGLGLTDALITKLGSLKQIVVRPTSAVTPFADVPTDSVEIGRKLNVDVVLEGTIQESEGRLRINARLIDTGSGVQIWTESFDEPAGRIFALQDALSNKIAKTLAFELSKSENSLLTYKGTDNPEAYEKYLRGRFYQSQNTREGFNRSIEFYEQAIALDPNFAEAYAGIADANVLKFNFAISKADEVIPVARQAVNRALQLNPDLSTAYTSLALIQFLYDRDWKAAELSLQRAIELDPNNANAYLRYGYFLTNVGRFEDAMEKLEKARELNPLSVGVRSNIGLAYLCARRYPEAIDKLERTAGENPQFAHPQWLLGVAYEASGDLDNAFEANLKALEIEGGIEFANQLRNIRATKGLQATNAFWFDESAKARKNELVLAVLIAGRAATIKNREQTLFWLEKSLEEGDPTLSGSIRYLAKYDFVRDDPRFQSVVSKLAF